MIYNTCEYCGATLDPGETCDCLERSQKESHDEYVVVISPHGECTIKRYVQGINKQLHQLQELVGGYIAIVSACKDGYIIIVDDEGASKDRPFNIMASAVRVLRQPLFGPAVVAKVGINADGERSICGMAAAEAQEWITDLALLKPSR